MIIALVSGASWYLLVVKLVHKILIQAQFVQISNGAENFYG
jgi:hypothetical protein